MATPPQAIIIAGPNGSGKSTAASRLLPQDLTFINADAIAQEITGKPGAPGDINAGRLLISRVDGLENRREDFAFETTLATVSLAERVRRWKEAGYQVHLIFFWVHSDDLAVARVAARVQAGGHDVPEATIRRRYRSGVRNFFRLYGPLADTWRMYDNSEATGPRLIAKCTPEGTVSVQNEEIWRELSIGDPN